MTLADYTITKDEILSKFSDIEIFSHYFEQKVDEYNSYINPLRNDKNPGCKFFFSAYNDLLFYDHAKGKTYNWISFVKEYYNLDTYYSIITRVAEDLGLIKKGKRTFSFLANKLPSTPKVKKSKLTSLNFSFTPYTTEHIDYWSSFDYTFTMEDAIKYRILPFSYYVLTFDKLEYVTEAESLGFIYFLTPDKVQRQVYMPFVEQKRKFRQLQKDNVFGFEYLEKGNPVILTKSYKDYVITKLAGFNSLCLLAENYSLDFNMYSKIRKFGKIYTLLDPDPTGIARSEKLKKEYMTTPLYFDVDVKDAYGHYKKYGIEHLKQTLNLKF